MSTHTEPATAPKDTTYDRNSQVRDRQKTPSSKASYSCSSSLRAATQNFMQPHTILDPTHMTPSACVGTLLSSWP